MNALYDFIAILIQTIDLLHILIFITATLAIFRIQKNHKAQLVKLQHMIDLKSQCIDNLQSSFYKQRELYTQLNDKINSIADKASPVD